MTESLPAKPAPVRRVPNFRRQAGRRDEIIAAALEVFFRHGYDQGRLEDVAKLSGVGKSAVLYHFGSKLGLVASVVAELCLPSKPLGHGPAEEQIETSLADPTATKVLRLVMSEQRRLPSLGQALRHSRDAARRGLAGPRQYRSGAPERRAGLRPHGHPHDFRGVSEQ